MRQELMQNKVRKLIAEDFKDFSIIQLDFLVN